MDELNMLRKKVLELERDNRLFKETEKELHATNQQLQESEKQLKSKQETLIQTQRIARVGSWEWEVATDTVTWSDELFRIFKLNPENGAVSYADHPKIYTPDSMQQLDTAVQRTLKTGEPFEIDLEIIRADGTNAFCTAQGYAENDENGKVIRLFGSLQDITERKNAEEHLKKIQWLLQNKKEKTEISIPDYGDLTTINQNRTILDSVGKEVLNGIVIDYLSLLETSAAVYEKNGDYAVGIFSSEYCQFMDSSSRALCKTKSNKKALDSGKWLCHESCWADASNQAIQTNKPVDIECSGGLNIYAIPIRANNEVIGSINFGYGNPPTEENKLKEIAANYNVSVDKLKRLAKSYETRPAFIIDIAKEKLDTSSTLIGNIVERKQMEEDLKRNQKRYEKAQALGHVGNWEYDPVTTNFWASDEAKRIYGYDLSLKNFSTEIVESCIPERERVHQALVDLLENNRKYDLIFDIITYDKGIRKTIHSIADLEKDAQGNPLKITGVIIDITIQKKAEDELKALNQQLIANDQQLRAANQQLQANEQQLKASNQQLIASEQQLRAANQQLMASEQQQKAVNQQLEASEKDLIEANKSLQIAIEDVEKSEKYLENIIENIADPIFVKDEDSKLLIVNDAFCQLFGLNKKNIIGKDLAEDVSPEERESFLRIDKMVLNNGKENVNEETLTVRGGETKTIATKKSRFLDEKGRKFLIGVIRDITERKQSEIELLKAKEKAQESEEKYKALYENAPLAYQSLNENGSFNDVNPTWLSTLGYKREEVIGKFFKDFLHLDWQSHFEKNYPAFKKRGYVSDVQFKIRHKKGHYLDISFEGCIGYHSDGSFKQTYCVFQDITEKKQALEDLLIAKEKAEESDRLKSAFLANMSHEIRTPMNGILGFTSLLKKPNLTGEEQQKFIEIIQKSGNRMLNTVNDIIDVSRIESGIVELSLSEVNITEQLKYLHSFFKPEATKNGTQLLIKNEINDQDFRINTDAEKLNSILTNLIKNAIKYTSQGSIEMAYSLKNENGQDYVEFSVKDTGVGIKKDRQTAIFDRFVQADIEDIHAKQGSGLGLTISKAYTEMLGGRMWIDSVEGLGSTFYFTIKYNPLSDQELNQENNGQFLNEDSINEKLKILIVDDDETSDMLICAILEEISLEILHAKNGLEAIEYCRNNPDLDLIFMDIKMPVLGGYDTTRQIRQFNKDVIVIAQTAYGLLGDREKAIEAGCSDYITKPISKSELLLLIRKYFK
ncbi:MAG: PAS domain S-box protein [Bacteroidales bacterium]|nr:PAS domain S-box protein [Bacteroidales bacterium]MCF8390211.1 PAS domain S-box protein [Bacteroidales bacterium]